MDDGNDGKLDRGGAVYIDDFEGSASSFDLRTPANNWVLASVPQNDRRNNNPFFPESQFIDSTISGVNRALLNWYRIDQSRGAVGGDTDDYTVAIRQQEVFPNLQLEQGRLGTLQSLDLTYYPNERGPYNFEHPGGTPYSAGMDEDGKLLKPETRWAGIMRSINNNDFEAANIEFVEMWILNPFMERNDGSEFEGRVTSSGDLYLNLGNISEDILRDSRRFFENGLYENSRPDVTEWGRIPRTQAITTAFDNDPDVRARQDVGLDGLNDTDERDHFEEELNRFRNEPTPNGGRLTDVAFDNIFEDPSNDNFVFFRDPRFDTDPPAPVLERYKKFNGPEGNSQSPPGNSNLLTSGTNVPDTEDLNKDNTLNETESYFQYHIPLIKVKEDGTVAGPNDIGPGFLQFNDFVTDSIQGPIPREAGRQRRVWYRIKIPLNQYNKAIGGIQDFRSIRFIRMYLKNFNEPTTVRFGRLELVRNQWRRYRRNLVNGGPATTIEGADPTLFDVNAVNIEENSRRTPFNYVLPPGIQREQSISSISNILQNEQSLSLDVCNLPDGDARAIYKILNLDMRTFNRLRMFVHAESMDDIPPGKLTMFMRLGSDFEKNYYEYEIPITLSDPEVVAQLAAFSEEYIAEVWKRENSFDFAFDLLKDVKVQRNSSGTPLSQLFETTDPNNPNNLVRVRGNPNLGLVKGVMIGIRNKEDDGLPLCAEMWINELRVNGFDERGGTAALARLDMQLADFGSLTLSGNYSSIGWGSLDQKLAGRQREEILQYDVAGSVELGKFFPENSGIRIPMYAQYSKVQRSPEFDPYDYDIPLKEKLAAEPDRAKRDSIRSQAADVTEIKSINFTNVRKERTNSERAPMPWDVSNFSFTYAYSQTDRQTPLIESDKLDQHRGAVDYTYSLRPNFITPFKKLSKNKHLRLITDFNFNPVPNSFSFSTQVDRQKQTTKYRFAGDDVQFNTFFDKRFNWDRTYDLNWDFSKGIKFNYSALNNAVIDELTNLDEEGNLVPLQERKDFIWGNVRNLGRTRNYSHNFNVNYTAPFKQIPLLDWINLKAQYSATYDWNTNALWDLKNRTVTDTLGNVIQNSQNRQVNLDLNFDKLYDKSKYLAKINKPRRGKSKSKSGKTRSSRREPASRDPDEADKDGKDKKGKDKKEKKKKNREPSQLERIAIRPLMLMRKARLSYAETFRTVVPGFTPRSRLLGMSEGFEAPGWAFIAGLQPDISPGGWLDEAADRGWITDNVFQNQQVVQNYTQSFDAKFTIEPFKDFRIDVDANRSFT
ncbi:MAG: cell surface protein SprA, partial [Bacteroidota bacterium]